MSIKLEKQIIKQSFPKLSEKDIQIIFNMYPSKGQSDDRLTMAYNTHLVMESRYSV